MRRPYFILDVFTDEAFSGNPLAVVRDCDDLDDARMQTIAAEFNLSETVFLQSPRDPVNTARARIFTPKRELPFAGHPTVGAAVLIGLTQAQSMLAARPVDVVLEEGVGEVRCTVRKVEGRATRATFALPRLPAPAGEPPSREALARALSLNEEDIGFEGHASSVWSAGVGFTFVPLASRDALARARPDMAHWDAIGPADHPAVYAYARETFDPARHVSARMFAPSLGIAEDPATGSAAAAFAGVCMACEKPADGTHVVVIEQGYDMGRPSQIALTLHVEGGALMGAEIGGGAVIVAEGAIEA
jgi:trans-2,3-dihydro-3-hydroxyanthranilate isomerase